MKVLQMNCVYDTGSTGKIMKEIHASLLSHNNESIIVYGRGKKAKDNFVYKTCSNFAARIHNFSCIFTGKIYDGMFFQTNRAINVIKKEKPDIVHIHCINNGFINIYRLLRWLSTYNYNVIITLHADFMFTANCDYAYECEKWRTGCDCCENVKYATRSFFLDNTKKSWNKMKLAYSGFDRMTIVSVSPWLLSRAATSPFLERFDNRCILNGVNTNIFHLVKEKADYKKRIVLHVTPFFTTDYDDRKGGYYLNKIAELFIDSKDVVFWVIGPYRKNKMYSPNIFFFGEIKSQEDLARFYSAANVTLLTSKKETFSMVLAESMCCGTPVVGFKAGAPEEIAIREYSSFSEFGDYHLLAQKLKEMLYQTWDKDAICKAASKKYSFTRMCSQYLDLYSELIGDKNVR